MEPKSIAIIETASKLFAKKGFSSTSVQEIAEECGISKGAFYLHFKSKDALLFEMFTYHFHRVQEKVSEVERMDLPPRETFVDQLCLTFEEIAGHREFIIMQIREQAIPFNENIGDFLTKMRFNSYLFYKNHLENIYGDEVEETVWEISLLLQAIFKGFMDLLIVEGAVLDFRKLSEAILRRADFLVDGFKKSGDQPVINQNMMTRIIPKEFYESNEKDLLHLLQTKREQSDGDLRVTFDVLIEEMKQPQPRQAVIRGMLYNLEEDEPALTKQIRRHYELE